VVDHRGRAEHRHVAARHGHHEDVANLADPDLGSHHTAAPRSGTVPTSSAAWSVHAAGHLIR
jgi:hypothetical protein